MKFELDGFVRFHTKVMPREKFSDDWSGNYISILWDKSFEAPGFKVELGEASGQWLGGVVAY